MIVTNLEVLVGTASILTCTVTGIQDPVTITWSGPTDFGDGYTQEFGKMISGKQTTELTVSGDVVTKDKTFTCTVTGKEVADQQQDVLARLEVYGK